MKKTEISEFNDNIFNRLSQWALLSVGDATDFNTMTVSWGGIGVLWGKSVCIVAVRTSRHTFTYSEKVNSFTLSFFGGKEKEALAFCGANSSRDIDKIKSTGLVPITLSGKYVSFDTADLCICCDKIYSIDMDKGEFFDNKILPAFYNADNSNDMHKIYICEIKDIYATPPVEDTSINNIKN